MSGIILCQDGDSFDQICSSDSAKYNKDMRSHFREINSHIKNTESLKNGQALIIPDKHSGRSSASTQFIAQSSPASLQNLSDISSGMTGSQLLALAEVSEKFNLKKIAPDLNTFGGAGLGVATTRASDFLIALSAYDNALKKYHDLVNHRAAPNTLLRAKQVMATAFTDLQVKFNRETAQYFNRYPARMESVAVQHVGRPTKVGHRTIPLTTSSGARGLAKFASYGKGLGYGMVALDGYFRYQSVEELYQTGGHWQREAWAQGAGLEAGLIAGAFLFGLFLGPLGLVVGVIAAGTTAVLLDKAVVSGAHLVYDSIY